MSLLVCGHKAVQYASGLTRISRILPNGTPLWTAEAAHEIAHSVLLSPDGHLVLVTTSRGVILLLSAATGEILLTREGEHTYITRASAWLGSHMFVTGSHQAPRILIWNRAGKVLSRPLQHTSEVHGMTALHQSVCVAAGLISAPHQHCFASGGLDFTVIVWRVAPTETGANGEVTAATPEVLVTFPMRTTNISLASHPFRPLIGAGMLNGDVRVSFFCVFYFVHQLSEHSYLTT
eukprot:TRINITY_DN4550_c0_g1_i2.p1 TRINITY_DN4550_c0_g1~~TRINITY_DN4550_c0_g1_i2.p1  ORF type:complete len:254 (-),score=37.70 TRINITY_DN4550_c0_g1_i2:475-1179(-)